MVRFFEGLTLYYVCRDNNDSDKHHRRWNLRRLFGWQLHQFLFSWSKRDMCEYSRNEIHPMHLFLFSLINIELGYTFKSFFSLGPFSEAETYTRRIHVCFGYFVLQEWCQTEETPEYISAVNKSTRKFNNRRRNNKNCRNGYFFQWNGKKILLGAKFC